MTQDGKLVWAAAFAQEALKEIHFYKGHGKTWSQINERVSGFNCAEIADIVVQKLREALQSEDAPYLMAHGHIETQKPEDGS